MTTELELTIGADALIIRDVLDSQPAVVDAILNQTPVGVILCNWGAAIAANVAKAGNAYEHPADQANAMRIRALAWIDYLGKLS